MTDPRWASTYRIGGAAAVAGAVVYPLQILAFVVWPPPFGGSVTDWFAVLHDNPLRGLLGLDLGIIIDYVLLIPVLLALYVALRWASESLAALGLITGLIGIGTYFASNPAFDMLALTDQYRKAPTDAERAATVAVARTMLNAVKDGTGFHVAYFLVSVAIVLLGVAMLWSDAFGRVTGCVGIVGGVLGFAYYLPDSLLPQVYDPATETGMGDYVSILAIVGLDIWYVLLARGLFRLERRVRHAVRSPGTAAGPVSTPGTAAGPVRSPGTAAGPPRARRRR